ncbi:TIGR04222 domain-containing membrane protein [Plantactinospora mayteni]|nr:TIGR04222 domain-containing membrane protein [Plantactinospora mayteni]
MNLGSVTGLWDVGSSMFLPLYLGSAVVLLVAAVVHRHRLLAGRSSVPGSAVTAQQAAYLTGGGRLAIYASLAALHVGGCVAVAPASGGRLVVTGALPAGATALDVAIHQAAGLGWPADRLGEHDRVAAELAMLRTGLERAGLLPTDRVRWTIRGWAHLMQVVVIVGVFWFFTQSSDGGFHLLLPIIALSTAVTILLRRPKTWRTRAGDRALANLRAGQAHLDPAQNPSWRVYGPGGAAMGVGVFGSGALWAADPGFASDCGIPNQLDSSSTSGGGPGGGTCAGSSTGSSSCGSSSCGSSSSSSSCGSSG